MEQNDEKPLKKPSVYDELYPGRFIKAGELLGKKVTVTIADVDLERLQGDDGKQQVKCIISFRETEKKLVACKTNGLCIKEMFGRELAEWKGKRITLFPDTWNGEPAIRVWGSPDLEADKEVTVTLPRRRPFKKTLHRVERAAA
jgi:hypothetical protein